MRLLTLLLSLTMIPTVSFAADAGVFVKRVVGEVTLNRARIKGSMAQGAQLESQDEIKTGKDAVVDIVWNNNWGYRLLGKSECVLKSIDKKHTVIEMKKGNIIFNVVKLPSGSLLEVSTPIAVAAVRGTQFWGRVDGKDTTFAVREGSIEVTVKDSGDTFKIKAGQAFDIDKGGGFSLPRSALEVEMNAMKQADEIPVSEVIPVSP